MVIETVGKGLNYFPRDQIVRVNGIPLIPYLTFVSLVMDERVLHLFNTSMNHCIQKIFL